MTHGLSRYLFACPISGAGSPPHTDGQMHTLTITLTVPGTTLMMHGAPALVLAQHLGRNLRFKGSPVCDRPPSSILRHQCRSRQALSEHARPVLGQRTTVVIEQIPCLCGLCADISVRNVRPHNARARTCLKSWFNDGAPSFLYREICNGQLRLEPPLPLFYLDSIWLKSQS